MNDTNIGKEMSCKLKNFMIITGIVVLILLISVLAVIIEQGSKYGF